MRNCQPSLRAIALALILTSPASAQVQAWEFQGEAAGYRSGSALSTIEDLDGDQLPDLLIGTPRSDFGNPNAGSVHVVSGASGLLIRRLDGSGTGELFGQALAQLGDLTGDGVMDLVVGAPFASIGLPKNGRAEVFSGADGSSWFEIPGIEQFGLAGSAVCGLGDANGDGVPDLVVCAPYEDSNGTDSGTVYVHSGLDGSIIRSHTGDATSDRLGLVAVSLGDINGDGIGDYAASTPYGNSGRGMLRVWSGASGSEIYTRLGTEVDAQFASAVCTVDDLTGDGRPEIAIGAPNSDLIATDAGLVILINGATGALVTQLPSSIGQLRGSALADAGDWNGDGTGDLVVSAPGSGTAGMNYIISLADSSELAQLAGLGTNQGFTSSLAGQLDVNGDGQPEIAIGFLLADGAGIDSGLTRCYSRPDLLGTAYCLGDGSSETCPCGNLSGGGEGCANSSGTGALLTSGGSPSVPNDDLLLLSSGLLPNKAGLAFVGTEAVNSGLGNLFGDGLRCAGGTVQRLGVRIPDGAGSATWGPGLGAITAWSAGDTRYFQVWYRDIPSSPCGSGFNLSNGLELQLLP